MRQTSGALLLAVLLGGCGAPTARENESSGKEMQQAETPRHNTLTEAEKAEGWVLLFDGESTRGWHAYLRQDAANWKVVNGELTMDTTGGAGASLLTDGEYENFHLVLDWKISKGGNSGIIFSVQEDEKYKYDYFTGPEMQVLDDANFPHPTTDKQKAGALYDLIAPSAFVAKGYDEWNTAEIIKKDDSLRFILNGTEVVSTRMWDEAWNKLIEGSKFKQWPGFGTFRKGKISLQDHSSPVWYRNIKLKPL